MASSDASIRLFHEFGSKQSAIKAAAKLQDFEMQESNGGKAVPTLQRVGAFQNRTQLKHAKKVVIKMGSAVITRYN